MNTAIAWRVGMPSKYSWQGEIPPVLKEQLSEEELNWMRENEAYVNQDYIGQHDSLEGNHGSSNFSKAADTRSLADVFDLGREDLDPVEAKELFDKHIPDPFHRACLYEREVNGRSSKAISSLVKIVVSSAGTLWVQTKDTSQVENAIKRARKKLHQSIPIEQEKFNLTC